MLRRPISDPGTQMEDLGAHSQEPEDDRALIQQANEQRAARRGYLVFATDPNRAPEEPGYREVFATEGKTPAEATAKVRPLAQGRRLRTFLATGTYKNELANAHWVS